MTNYPPGTFAIGTRVLLVDGAPAAQYEAAQAQFRSPLPAMHLTHGLRGVALKVTAVSSLVNMDCTQPMLLDHVLYEVESDARMNIPLPDLPPATGPVIETDVIHADLKRLGDEATKLCKHGERVQFRAGAKTKTQWAGDEILKNVINATFVVVDGPMSLERRVPIKPDTVRPVNFERVVYYLAPQVTPHGMAKLVSVLKIPHTVLQLA